MVKVGDIIKGFEIRWVLPLGEEYGGGVDPDTHPDVVMVDNTLVNYHLWFKCSKGHLDNTFLSTLLADKTVCGKCKREVAKVRRRTRKLKEKQIVP